MPTDLRTTSRPILTADKQLIALVSLLPWSICLLLAHAYPAIAMAFALAGRLS